jgi:hypothetical protein
MLITPERRTALTYAWAAVVGLIVALLPLWVHNYRAAGTLLWPDLALMRSAELRLALTYDWNTAAYDPTVPIGSAPFLSREWVSVHLRNLQHLLAAWDAGPVIPGWLVPFVFCSGVTWLMSKRGTWSLCKTPYDVFVAAAGLLAGGAALIGSTVHPERRYFLFMMPVLSVLGFAECARLSRILLMFGLLVSARAGLDWYAMHADNALATQNVNAYRSVAELLPPDAVVMTQNPWEFSFHTRRPSVVVPYTDNDEIIKDIARRYQVEYLVIIAPELRHRGLKRWEQGELPPYFERIAHRGNLVVARFAPDSGISTTMPR